MYGVSDFRETLPAVWKGSGELRRSLSPVCLMVGWRPCTRESAAHIIYVVPGSILLQW